MNLKKDCIIFHKKTIFFIFHIIENFIILYSSINSSIGAPGGTIGKTLSSLSISKSITVGISVCFKASKIASSTSSGFVTLIPFALKDFANSTKSVGLSIVVDEYLLS